MQPVSARIPIARGLKDRYLGVANRGLIAHLESLTQKTAGGQVRLEAVDRSVTLYRNLECSCGISLNAHNLAAASKVNRTNGTRSVKSENEGHRYLSGIGTRLLTRSPPSATSSRLTIR